MYDEYFCPNCNATLNNQYGFNPSAGSWTCKRCGTHLSDSAYGGNRFEDVSWYCDSCGAFLNKQSGFSDTYDYWDCTECGHSNHISQDEIINSNYSSDTSTSSSSSSSAGPLDVANSLLKLLNSVADIAIDFKKNKDKAAQEEARCKERKIETSSAHTTTSHQNERTPSTPAGLQTAPIKELEKIRANAFYWTNKKIPIGFDSYKLLHKDVNEIFALLFNRAFTNIKTIPVKDIYVNSKYTVGEVEQIVIGGSQYFEATDTVPYDAEIIIVHHQKREITVPFSSKDVYGRNYTDVADELQRLGLTEIYVKPIKDLLNGGLIKDGAVERVILSRIESLEKNATYVYDTKMLIEYHTFKN